MLHIPASIDKNQFTHFVPLHREAAEAIRAWLYINDSNNGAVFNLHTMQRFLIKERIQLKYGGRHFCIKDARKYFQQKSDALQIPREIVNFCMAHETGGIVNKHYARLTPPTVCNAMKGWDAVKFK